MILSLITYILELSKLLFSVGRGGQFTNSIIRMISKFKCIRMPDITRFNNLNPGTTSVIIQ